MKNKLIQGRLLAALVGLPFRLLELLIRALQLGVRLVRKVIQRAVARSVDPALASWARRRLARTAQVDASSIVLVAMQGEYTCNPKYIAEEILRRGLPYRITWVLRDDSAGPYPGEFNLVEHGSAEFYRELAAAKVVVQNGHSLQRAGVAKGPNQYWLQTWHGSLGLKKLEGAGGDTRFYEAMRRLDTAQTDLVFTNSTFEETVFEQTYWPGVEKSMLGHARNDLLFDRTAATAQMLRKRVLDRLGIADRGQRFLLYAPTHDDNTRSALLGGIDVAALRRTLGAKFGGEWEILIRTHNSNKRASDSWMAGFPVYCHNASFYGDMQELLMVADAGLSDYSSWVCDYILTAKPAFLFSADLDAYSELRGFYHDFNDTPFTMSTSNAELLGSIEAFDQAVYDRKTAAFLEMCGSIDDGHAASRIVDRIEALMAG